MNAMSPIDQKFFELIIPIATFLTGTLSGIMLAGGDKDLQAKALEAANKGGGGPDTSSRYPITPSLGGGGFSASANIGGNSFSFNRSATSPAQTLSTPTASSGASPKMSSTGKPMPVLEDDEEL